MFDSIEDIMQANEENGNCFFHPDTINFFGSVVYPEIYRGQYFITGENNFDGSEFRFTIRKAHSNGRISTVGQFQEYATLESARDALTIFFDDLETD